MSTIDSNNASNPVRILMVDDDVAFSRVVRAILQLYRQRTFIITWKESVESALVEIEQNQDIDLILTDYYFQRLGILLATGPNGAFYSYYLFDWRSRL
jgi:CheY-like chemotaxis protein